MAVIGPGRMGTGIALTFAMAGFSVRIVDTKDRPEAEYARVASRTVLQLRQHLSFLADISGAPLDADAVLSRVELHHRAEQAIPGCGFVFEAVPERPELKLDTLRLIEPLLDPGAIVGSATSSIDLGTLRQGFARPERLLITHWLNPAFLIPVVEVAHSDKTDADAVSRMCGLLTQVDKLPVVLRDSPGFIVPRIQSLAMNEGVRMVEEGVATPTDIDRAVTFGFAFRLCCMGLMEFIDIGGLDILYNADSYLQRSLSAARFEAPEMVKAKMAANELGIRTGRGIYDWEGVDTAELVKSRFRSLYRLLEFLGDELKHERANASVFATIAENKEATA